MKRAKCRRCQMSFPMDKDIDRRKERHEEKHNRNFGIRSERDGHIISKNNVIGKVEWEVVDE